MHTIGYINSGNTITYPEFDYYDTLPIRNPYPEYTDFIPDYSSIEREEIQAGWHNPRKILIPAQYTYNRIELRIRNQLPYKKPRP